ncbi:baseplate J/gp47 family protein [Nocardia bovistercoris]|uniref:Baseplate J/gp47 family protein n=1 Tax=Nocardia bovistercoris TaxID=2785916 RepID=A0A931I875_9NOCA|nr:baseplate J/gp47 family protein [Nocardia bovistercoris]MBH0775547.1 baseplate J/gp47 family protein [Nocardia bovistercoris]
MADIVASDGKPVIDYTGRDYSAILRALREQIPRKLPEWTGHASEADFGNVLLELFAQMADVLSYYQDRVANEAFLATAVTRRSVIEHLRLIGYRMRTAAPAATVLTVTIPGGAPVPAPPLVIRRGAAFATKSRSDAASVRFEYARADDLAVTFTPVDERFPDGPKSAEIPVEEGRLIAAEVIGTADGTPGQRYPLIHRGLILRPSGPQAHSGPDIILQTSTPAGGQPRRWSYCDTLAFSRADRFEFTVDIDENDQATIVFGDGTFGARPDLGALITATYRVGGGPEGNVGVGAICAVVDVPGLAALGARVVNRIPATGGAERESIDAAVEHAPAVFRSSQRAVTTADYEALVRSYDGVGKVRAAAGGWNRVLLFVAPSGGGKVSDTLELGIKRFLEDKRMLTQIIEVRDVEYVEIFVTAEVGFEPYFRTADVVAAVRRATGRLLAFDAVGFGETVYLSRFYDAIQSTAGVRFTNITRFEALAPNTASDPEHPVEPSGRIKLSRSQIPIAPRTDEYASGIKIVPAEQERNEP